MTAAPIEALLALAALALLVVAAGLWARWHYRHRDPRPRYLPVSRFDRPPEFSSDWRRDDDLAIRRLLRDIHRAGDRP